MQTRITNYEQFYWDLQRHGIAYAAEHTLSLGFDSVEFLGVPPSPVFDPNEAARVLSESALPVTCFSVGITLYAATESERRKAEACLLRYADAAATVGSPYFHHTLLAALAPWENAPAFQEVLPLVADSAERIARYCEDLGMVCLYEPQGIYFNGEGVSLFFEEMQKRCGNVGICGDVGNPYFVDADPAAIFHRHAKDIRHVHLKDYAVQATPFEKGTSYKTLGGRFLQDTVLGEGDIDLSLCLEPLRRAGYTGAFSIEHSGSDEAIKRDMATARRLLTAFDEA